MPSPKTPSDDLLRTAARLRAGGMAWAAVGREVGRSQKAVWNWPSLYPLKWATFYAQAEQAILEEASAESVHVLRQQLRSRNERSSREAAGKLIRSRQPAGPSVADPSLPPVSAGTLALAQYLESLTDADLERLAAELAPRSEGPTPGTPGHEP